MQDNTQLSCTLNNFFNMKKLNRILLIDDDNVTNFINKDLLEGLNIAREIHVVEDGEKAFDYLINCGERYSQDCPDLVIFDHQMPNMDGKELIEALNKLNFFKEHKAVFMFLEVNSFPKDVEALKDLGVQEFTSKPLSQEKIMDVYNKYWSLNMVNA